MKHVRTESDLQHAIDNGLLSENHWLDLKTEVGTSRSENRGFAKDCAAFALDGGEIIVGVHEEGEKLTLTPVELGGLKERLEQIAHSLPKPPVPVSIQTIPSELDPERGYLVVDVKPSLVAPHMVDYKYYGRGDTTNINLGDDAVLRLHQTRESQKKKAEVELQAYIERDPIGAQDGIAPIFAVAVPLTPRNGMLGDFLREGAHEWDKGREILNAAFAPHKPMTTSSFGSDLSTANSPGRRPDGYAFNSHGLARDRSVSTENATGGVTGSEVEFNENGTIRVFCSQVAKTKIYENDDKELIIFDFAVPLIARRLVNMAVAVSDDCDYRGGWALGLAVTRIKGGIPISSERFFGSSAQAYTHDEFRQHILTTTRDLAEAPGTVAEQLSIQFLRALATENRHTEFFENPE